MSNQQVNSSTQDEQAATGKAEQPIETKAMGAFQGFPGRRVHAVGVLDLRGVPAEQVAQIESIHATGVVLLDEQNRLALERTSMHAVGSVVVAGPEVRVMVEPCLEIEKATMEGMVPGQKLLLVGIVFFKPDVPAALVTEKLESLQVVGVLLACAGVQGALMGKLQITGVSVTLPEDVGPMVRSVGQTTMDVSYLSHLQDGIVYLNIGQTFVSDDVTEELLAQKIGSYYNVGQTIVRGPLLGLLKARCPVDAGQFKDKAEWEKEQEEARKAQEEAKKV